LLAVYSFARALVELRFYRDVGQQAIARMFGVTEGCISQKVSEVIRCLQRCVPVEVDLELKSSFFAPGQGKRIEKVLSRRGFNMTTYADGMKRGDYRSVRSWIKGDSVPSYNQLHELIARTEIGISYILNDAVREVVYFGAKIVFVKNTCGDLELLEIVGENAGAIKMRYQQDEDERLRLIAHRIQRFEGVAESFDLLRTSSFAGRHILELAYVDKAEDRVVHWPLI